MAVVEVDILDRVAVVTLNRPEQLNALSQEVYETLELTIPRLADDPGVGCMVITGAGRAFCAGGDVKGMTGSHNPLSYEERVAALLRKSAIVRAIYKFPKVTIAMVNGAAAGAGLNLALACDFRFGCPVTKLTTGFAKIGFSGDLGGTYLMTALIGADRAKALYLSSEKLDAEQAHALDLLSALYPTDQLHAETMRHATAYAAGPVLAYAYIKRNFAAVCSLDLQQSQEAEAFFQIRLANSEDHAEATQAFKEKRAPVFKGR